MHDVPSLKSLLSKVGVPHSVNKPSLQLRLFYAVRLGLNILPTQEEKDKQVAAAHTAKLDLGQGFMLPHPLTLDNWEQESTHFPNVQKKDIEQYFDKCKI